MEGGKGRFHRGSDVGVETQRMNGLASQRGNRMLREEEIVWQSGKEHGEFEEPKDRLCLCHE